ncbi:NUDIX domain-containing protein [Pseudonocardia sp. C8]|uniref:NUDIX domain-containing protein n=1 Tax=Saccharopolyspora cebuensis TaxID=418759 RepID=A0ABV4CN62_9PSEU|nr:NUDIX domain-containing protein [Pseudonocardia sp. C8]MBC3194031.1 NUDIX domain-containing protein [Pseudonocardia sp. C8]
MSDGLIGHDQYVLLCRYQGGQHWTLPGGAVTPGDPVERSLLRTLREDFGLSIHDYRFSAAIENIDEKGAKTSHEIHFVFEVDLAQPASEGIRNGRELKWCWWGSIDSLDIRPRSVAEHLRDPEQQQRVWAPWAANADPGTQ